jgi:peptidoglycan hydrolase-like protein with peptidoglycan-binding domain
MVGRGSAHAAGGVRRSRQRGRADSPVRAAPATARHLDLVHAGGVARLDAAGRQAALLALQRSHGNAAVLRAIAREGDAGAAGGGHATLRMGSEGAAVRALQDQLNRAGVQPALDADGAFGPRTLAAVRAFQSAGGLTADGIVGPRTWALLDGGGVRVPANPTVDRAQAPDPRRHQEVLARVQAVLARLRGIRGGRGGAGGDGGAGEGDDAIPAFSALPEQPRRELSAGPAEEPRTPAPRLAGADEDEGSWLDQVAGEVGQFADDPAGYVTDVVTDVANEVVEQVTETVGGIVETARETVEGVIDAAAETVGGAAREVGKLIEDPLGYVGAIGGKVVSTIQEAAGELAAIPDDLRRRYPEIMAAVEEGLKTLGQPFGVDVDLDDVTRRLDDLLRLLGGVPTADEVVFKDGCQEGYTQVDVSERTVTAHGSTVQDAVEDADQKQGGHVASVQPVFRLPHTFCPEEDTKPVVSAYVYVNEIRTTPVWAERDQMPAEAREIWDRWLAAVRAHEQRHIDIDRKHFEPMHKAAERKTQGGAIGAFNVIIDRADKENAALDAKEGRIILEGSGKVRLAPR